MDTDKQQPDSQDRSHLVDLYPQAKTLEDRVYDKQQKAASQAERRPKYIAVTTMLQLFGLVVGLFVAVHAGVFSFGLSVISGVSFGLLLIVLWLTSVYWVFASISSRFAKLGYSARPFLVGYVVLFPAAIYGLSLAVDPMQDRLLFAGGLVLIHVVLTAVLMRLVGARS